MKNLQAFKLFLGFGLISCTASIILSPIESYAAQEKKLLYSWTKRLGEGQTGQEENQLFFLGGLSADSQYFYVANLHSEITKRLTSTGEAVWRVPLEAQSQSDWLLEKDYLIGGDTKGNLYKLNAEDGKIIWKVNSKGILFSRPLVFGNLVYVQNSYGILQCYDLESGAWQWQQEDPSGANLNLWSAKGPVLFDERVLAGFPSGVLQAFEPLTGNRLWTKTFSLAVSESIGLNDVRSVSSDGEFVVASSYNGDLKAWHSQAGSLSPIWQKKISLHAPVVFDNQDGVKLIYASNRNQQVSAIELNSGYVRWQSPVFGGLASTVSKNGESIWLGLSSGGVVVLNAQDGQEKASLKSVGVPIYTSPLVLNESEAIVLDSRGILRRLHIF